MSGPGAAAASGTPRRTCAVPWPVRPRTEFPASYDSEGNSVEASSDCTRPLPASDGCCARPHDRGCRLATALATAWTSLPPWRRGGRCGGPFSPLQAPTPTPPALPNPRSQAGWNPSIRPILSGNGQSGTPTRNAAPHPLPMTRCLPMEGRVWTTLRNSAPEQPSERLQQLRKALYGASAGFNLNQPECSTVLHRPLSRTSRRKHSARGGFLGSGALCPLQAFSTGRSTVGPSGCR